jgi:hypothetical protein
MLICLRSIFRSIWFYGDIVASNGVEGLILVGVRAPISWISFGAIVINGDVVSGQVRR